MGAIRGLASQVKPMQRCWMNDFYVYLHRKKSDGRVFYVGKGRDRRAYRGDKSSRSDKWLNTANKYGWFVEIVFDNLSEDEAYALEVDTILEMQHFNEPLVCHNKGGHGGSVTTYTEIFGKRDSNGVKGYDANEVRKACHNFNTYCRKANLLHLFDTDTFSVVESYIAPVGMQMGDTVIKAGSWLSVLQFTDESIWAEVKNGGYSGVSIGAKADAQDLEEGQDD